MKSAALVALFVVASMPTVIGHEMEPESNKGFLQNTLTALLESIIAPTSLRADSVAGSSPSIVTPSVTLSERMSSADPEVASSSDSAVSVFREGTTPESSPTTITAQSGASSSDSAVPVFGEGTTSESSPPTITAQSVSGADMHPTKVVGSDSSISRPEPSPAAAAKPDSNTAAEAAPHPAAAELATISEVDPSMTIESDQNNVIKPGIVDSSINQLPVTVEQHSKPNPPADQPDEPIKRKTTLETPAETGLKPEDRLFNLGSILMSALVRSKVVSRFLTCSYRIIATTIEARNNGSLPADDYVLLQQYTNIGSIFHKYSIVSKLGHEVFEGPLWECFKDIAGGTLIFGYDELKVYINKFFDETKLLIEKTKPLDILNSFFKLSADKEEDEE